MMEIKAGTTLRWQVFLGDGAKQDLNGMAFRAQIRDSSDALIYELAVTVDLAARVFELYAPHSVTATWALKTYHCDIEVTDSRGDVVATNTFEFNVVRKVTR